MPSSYIAPGIEDKIKYASDPNNKDIKDRKILLEEFYKPPENIQKEIYAVYERLIRWRSLRDQPYKQFGQQSFLDYLDDARQKYWGFLPVSFDNDTPQFFFPETRNQINGVLMKIANLRMKPTFDGVNGFDLVTSTILKDWFEYWRRGANRKISNFWQFLYNIINGTVIVFTAYNSNVRKVKNITMYDPVTGRTEYKEEELDESDVEDVICNLEDIYLPKIWEPDIQQQDELIWRTLLKWNDFKNAFRGYSNHIAVVPGSQFADSSIFADFLSYDVMGSDFVEVIKYFNKAKDEYMIIANGILLNPLVNTNGDEEIAPMPWNHKKLPFSKTIFEPIDVNFFYGMPLAIKVKSPQEALNMLWELWLAREIKSVNAPIITNDPSIELGLEFKAGNIYQVQGDVQTGFKELGVSGATPSFQNAIASLQGILQRTGSGGVGPTTPSRQPKSATEESQIAQDKKEASGLPFMFYQDLLEQKVWLTLKNMIQFYTTTKTRAIMGDRKFNKIISLAEMKLYGGGMGNHEIRITDSPRPQDELRKESYLRSILRKERVDIIEVTPKELQKVNFDIKIQFEVENSPETERALYLDYISTIARLFGQSGLLSQRKMLYRTAEKFGESLSDIVDDKVENDYEQDRFGIPPKPQSPEDRVAAALAAGQGGGQNPQASGGQVPGGPGTPVGDNNQRMRGMMMGAGGGSQNILKKF